MAIDIRKLIKECVTQVLREELEDPLYVEYHSQRQGEEPFMMHDQKFEYVNAIYPNGKVDIGVYAFAGDMVYSYNAFRKMYNLAEAFDPTSVGPNPEASEGLTDGNPYAAWNAKMRTLENLPVGGEKKYRKQQPGGEMSAVNVSETMGRYAQEAGALKETLELSRVGEDDWSRPVYRDQNGKTYVDVNLGRGTPSIHTVTDSGEPEVPIRNFIIKPLAPPVQKTALCPRCKNSKESNMIRHADGTAECKACHWAGDPKRGDS